MYPDVLEAIRFWYEQGIELYIYSSGSVEAQQLLFQYSTDGDLSGYLRGHFDLAVGAKVDANSYWNIQASVGCDGSDLLFLSDAVPEVLAAREAGWQSILVEREELALGRVLPVVRSLSEVMSYAKI